MIKALVRRIIKKEKYNNDTFTAYLRKKGIAIGEGTVFFAPESVTIDVQTPWMITIGKNVQITKGVTILNHGYDWSVLKGVYGEVLGSRGEVYIGDNCFIGMNSTILKNTHIGNNVIIGANSLVNKDIPDNCVAAGNPCRVIMSLEDYYIKRKEKQFSEATQLVNLYRKRYGKEPDKRLLWEFFWLFEDDIDSIPEYYKGMNRLVGNETFTNEVFANHKKQFTDYEDFLNHIQFEKCD